MCEGWLANRSSRACRANEGWSGRRGSNPRPTAWKAVTLPLSYSRLRARQLRCFALRRASPLRASLSRLSVPLASDRPRLFLCRLPLALPTIARCPAPASGLACQPKLAKRAKVGGEGRTRTFEALGRQIYSLLRLTASLPRQLSVYGVRVRTCVVGEPALVAWSWRRDSNPRPADYKSAALPD